MNLFQVNLFVKSFPEMLRFYRDTLGFDVNDIEPGPPSVPLVNWASLRTGDIVLELFDAETFWDTELLDNASRHGVQLCFVVDDVDHERARLEHAGVRCDPVVVEPWGRYASFRDPEGNWLQIFDVSEKDA